MDGLVNDAFVDDNGAAKNGGPEVLSKNNGVNHNHNDTGEKKDDVPPAEEAPARQTWDNGLEFLMSCIAMSVGLGNIWRFPFIALENGGGAFLIPYLVVLLTVGKPFYYMEMLIGQFSSRGTVKVYDISPIMRGVGYGQMICTSLLCTYYASLMALTFHYLVASFSAELPWSRCQSDWNEPCFNSALDEDETSNTVNRTGMKSSSELYFLKEVLKESDTIHNGIGIPDWRLALCLVFAWICIFLVLLRGVKSSGKAAYFLALFPYVIMIVLLIRAVTLPGAGDGILFFITPQWNKLLDPNVWYAAVTQCFFSLSVCFGNIVMYASFNNFTHNVQRDSMIVTTLDTLTSLLAGCTIFGILGHLAHVSGSKDIGSFVKGGTGLAFVSYPEAISKFTFAPQFFAVMFFFMLFVLGIGSNVAMASNVVTVIRDQFPKVKNWQGALAVAVCSCSVGLIYVTPGGQAVLNLVDYFGASFIIYILGIAEIITITWIYGLDNFCQDVTFMLGPVIGKVHPYWRIFWGIITPLFMIVILVYTLFNMVPLTYGNYIYPDSAYAAGWCLASFGMLQLPFWAIWAIYKQKQKGFVQRFLGALKPKPNWGPTNPTLRAEWNNYKKDEKEKLKAEINTPLQRVKNTLLGR